MKKYLLIILLTLICIIPFNVSAEDVKNYYLYPSPINEEQKQIYLDYIYNHSDFISLKEQYTYYAIVLSYNGVSINSGYSYPIISVAFSNSLPGITKFSKNDFYLNTSDFDYNKALNFKVDFNDNSISKFSYANHLGSYDIAETNTTYLVMPDGFTFNLPALYIDYFLDINFEVPSPYELNLYDIDGNFIKNYPLGSDIFYKPKVIEPPKEYTIEDILNSDDIIYSLSKELIGPLPVEFQFIYSVVSLMLGILILIVIISPFVLLKRWLM